MNILRITLLTLSILIPSQLKAEEPTLSGHLEYHSADGKFTLAHFNWGKIFYDQDGNSKKPVEISEAQCKEIIRLATEFKKVHGDKKPEGIPKDYDGAVMIFSFRPPEAKETFTAGITEDDKLNWAALNLLREYLDKLANP